MEPSQTTVRLQGEFDVAHRTALREALLALADEPFLVLDLSQTAYMDSTALGCLIALHNARCTRFGGAAKMRIAGLQGQVARVFSITKLDEHFEVERATLPLRDADRFRERTIRADTHLVVL